MVIAQPINLNVSSKLHPHSLQRTRSPPGQRLPKRIRNAHPRNYYNFAGKDIDIRRIFCHDNSIHNIIPQLKKRENVHLQRLIFHKALTNKQTRTHLLVEEERILLIHRKYCQHILSLTDEECYLWFSTKLIFHRNNVRVIPCDWLLEAIHKTPSNVSENIFII